MKGETIDDAAIRMTEDDDVATALADLPAGREFEIDGETVALAAEIRFGHKFALTALAAGETVVKYGEVIGETTAAVDRGEWVHTHNVRSTRGRPSAQGGSPGAGESVEGTDTEGDS